MLRLRICPNCQQEIRSPKLFFCPRCGTKLPLPPKDASSETPPPAAAPAEKETSTKPATRKALLAALVLVMISALSGGVYYFFSGRKDLTPHPQLPVRREISIPPLNLELPNHPFTAKGLAEVIPADVDLYVEGRGVVEFLSSALPAEDWAQAESAVNDQLGLTVAEAASFLEDDFAIVREGTSSAFLARSRDVDFLEQQLADQASFEGWQARLVGGFLVIADSLELTAKIEAAFKKQILNLALTSAFVESRQNVPAGQVFVFGSTRPWFLPEDVKVESDAYVVAKKDGGTVIVPLPTLPQP